MYRRLYSFLNNKNIICDLRFGFRQQQYSASHALINITENMRKALDDGNICCDVFVDLQKAFDTVDHQILFFPVWVFFHEHSRLMGQQGKGEGIYLTPHYHFHPLRRHLDISWAITAESSPLHIASSRTRTENFWSPSASHLPLSYAPW